MLADHLHMPATAALSETSTRATLYTGPNAWSLLGLDLLHLGLVRARRLLFEHAPGCQLRSREQTHLLASRIMRSFRARSSFSRSSRLASHFPPPPPAGDKGAGAGAAGETAASLDERLYRSMSDWAFVEGAEAEAVPADADGEPLMVAGAGRRRSGTVKPAGGCGSVSRMAERVIRWEM